MKIAFDLDGVVLHQEMYSLKAIDSVQNEQERSELMRYYYTRRSIQLNPIDFLADEDELFFITGGQFWSKISQRNGQKSTSQWQQS